MAKTKTKKPKGSTLMLIALLILANPNIRVLDIFPDFIAYIFIIKHISYAAPRVPYFDEAKSNFVKLAWFSAIKIPGYILLRIIRMGDLSDSDIFALFSFTFGVIEAVLLIIAINSLFRALFYLGERSEASSILSSFNISKKKKMIPDALRVLSIVFSIYKCAMYALPEMLLLTKTVSSGEIATTFNVARLYPYVIVFAVITVSIFGIITALRFNKYINAIKHEGKFKESIDALVPLDSVEALKKKLRTRDMCSVLLLFIVSSVFTLDLRFDNVNDVNILPNFIFGILMALSLYRLSKYAPKAKKASLIFAVYSCISLSAWISEIRYLSEYGYDLLVGTLSFAKKAYVKVIVFSAIELVGITTAFVFTAKALKQYVYSHTGMDIFDSKYMRTDAVFHRELKTKIYIWTSIGIVYSISRFADVLFRYFSKSVFVGASTEISGSFAGSVTQGLIPWFSLVVVALAVVFFAYSAYLFGSLREETEFKYS